MINTIYTFVQKLCPKLSQAFIYVSWFTYGMCFLSFILNKPFSFIWILPYIMIVFLSLYLICVVALKTMPSLSTNIQISDKPGNGIIPQKADEERIKTLSDKYKSIAKRCLKCFEYFTAISIWPIISFWGTPLFSDVPTNITIGFTFTALLIGLIVAVVAFVNIKGFYFR